MSRIEGGGGGNSDGQTGEKGHNLCIPQSPTVLINTPQIFHNALINTLTNTHDPIQPQCLN